MLRAAREPGVLAITPDGPRGPRHSVAPGAVFLAARTDRALLPIGVAASRAWTLSSWDQHLVPKPFARVVIAYGDPLFVPREALDNTAHQEEWANRLTEAMLAASDSAASALGKRR